MFGILGIMAVLLAAGFVAADDSSAAASFNLAPSGDDYAKVSGSLTYKLTYAIDENMTYDIKLVDSDGKSAGSVSVSSGTLYASSTSKTFTVTMPSTAGDYTLELTVTQTVTDGDNIEYKRYAYARAVDPITLSVTVENNGDAKRFISFARHLPSINVSLGAKPGNKTTWSIGTTTGIYCFLNQVTIMAGVIIESRHAPMALRLCWFLFHREDTVISIYFCHT